MFYNFILFLFTISILFFTITSDPLKICESMYYSPQDLANIKRKTPYLSSATDLWTTDGIAICTAKNIQINPQIISDGAGGAIITWVDFSKNESSFSDIYAQKVNSTGDIQWISNGTIICAANNYQEFSSYIYPNEPQIISDGAGGAIITWEDYRNGVDSDIYIQRVNSKGEVLWVENGTAICTASNDQRYPQIVSDDAGGAIITWEDHRNGVYSDIYIQRVNSKGDVLWVENGTAICIASYSQGIPQICSDNNGGAIITWMDERLGIELAGFFAQRVNSTGQVQWTIDGVSIYITDDWVEHLRVCSDGVGGTILTWMEWRDSPTSNIFAQKVNSSGSIQWGINGTDIYIADELQYVPRICTDGNGGAIITWEYSKYRNRDIYAQRVNSKGDVEWSLNDTAICTEYKDQGVPKICSDGEGGAIIIWEDYRMGLYSDIYTQRVNSTGVKLWSVDGIIINTGNYSKLSPVLCSDGEGGAIITWQDNRNLSTTKEDIYAQRIAVEVEKKKKRKLIPFSSYYLLFTILGILSLVIIIKRNLISKA